MKDDRGSATILGAFAIIAVLSVLVVVANVAILVGMQHRVDGIADAAALAAAADEVNGEMAACASAREVLGGAALAECRLEGWDVTVTVSMAVQGRTLRASAKAGPVS